MKFHLNNKIYGIYWDIYDTSDNFIHHFEKVYSEPMKLEQIKEIIEKFNTLTLEEKKYMKAHFCTYCSKEYLS